ncbi:PQQ-binding-like beta-propeller repeat protein [Planctomycetota bacterium]
MKILSILILIITAAAAGGALTWWAGYDPQLPAEKRLPGLDGAPPPGSIQGEAVKIGEFFETFDGMVASRPVARPEKWPQFRGTDRTNIVPGVSLSDSWPDGGPPVLWTVDLGAGYAAPAVIDGRVLLLDYLAEEKADALRCFSLADGKEIWRRFYKVKVKNDHGMSRTIPAVTLKYAVTIGPMCQVMCVDMRTGILRWGMDLIREYGSARPPWHTGQCPLIEEDVAIIAPAGKDILIMGVDCKTGGIVWQTPNPDGWAMSHASVMPMTLNGKRMYVYTAIGGMAGVSAEPGEQGRLLWKTTAFNKAVIAPSPLMLDHGRILITAGYGAGSMVLQVTEKDGTYAVKAVGEWKPDKGLSSEQQTPLYYQDLVFCIQPKDAGALRKQFVCYRPDDLQTPIWSSGKAQRFGLGPYMIADDKFYIMDDRGTLTMARFSSSRFEILAQARIIKGREAWGPLALAGTRLLFRDLTRLVCVELGSRP